MCEKCDLLQAENVAFARGIEKLAAESRYIQGIVERGENRKLRDDECVDLAILAYVKKLQAEVERLNGSIGSLQESILHATECELAARQEAASLKSWKESTKSKLRNVAGWLNNGCAQGYAAAELLLIAGLPDDQSQPQPDHSEDKLDMVPRPLPAPQYIYSVAGFVNKFNPRLIYYTGSDERRPVYYRDPAPLPEGRS